ncbi:MAG: ERCC4 domain-containing protein [archaeon]
MSAIINIFSKKKLVKKENGKIVVDNREKNSLVPSFLMKKGFEIDWKQLPVGDYIVNGVAIERKTVSDFKSSIINKRLIAQLAELKQYPKHLLLVEGIIDEDLYNGGIHENAFRGFMLSVLLEYGTPVVFTHDEEDTVKYLSVLAKKEKKSEEGIRASKIMLSDREKVGFILEGFPNVGPKKARALIEKFGSLRGVVNADVEELKEILGSRAEDFKRICDWKK